MSGEQTGLVRVPKKELALSERKIEEQIARAKKGVRSGNGFAFGGIGVIAASLIGLTFVPVIALGAFAVGAAGFIGGAIKHDRNLVRVADGEKRRRDQRRKRKPNRLRRLQAAASAALETESRTLAMGRELRVDFEDEPPKILRVEEMGAVFATDADDRHIRLRIAASLYEAEAGLNGDLRPSGNRVCTMVRNFEPAAEAPPPSPQPKPEKKLPPCTPV